VIGFLELTYLALSAMHSNYSNDFLLLFRSLFDTLKSFSKKFLQLS